MRILLATFGSLGDLHPVIALGLELQRRGHAAAIVTSEYHRDRIRKTGLGFYPAAPDLRPDDKALIRATMDERRGPEEVVRFMLRELPRTYADYERAVNADGGADLIVTSDLAYAGPILAQKTGLAWASQVLSPISFLSPYDETVLPPLPWLRHLHALGPAVYGSVLGLAKRAARRLTTPINEFRMSLELPPVRDPFFDDKHAPALVLAMFSRLIAEPRPDWPPQTVMTGYAFYDGDEPDLPSDLTAFLDAGAAPIVSRSAQQPSSIPDRSTWRAPAQREHWGAGPFCSSARSRGHFHQRVATSPSTLTRRSRSCFRVRQRSSTRAGPARRPKRFGPAGRW